MPTINSRRALAAAPGSAGCACGPHAATRGEPSRPIAATSVYIDPAYGPAVRREVGRSKQLISTIIEEAYGTYTAEVRQEIRAVGITTAAGRKLGCEPGSPALEITRHYSDPTGRPFEITISLQPADRFSYVLKLRRLSRGAPAAVADAAATAVVRSGL